jgi:DNA-directed RNA polymerase specialized sigma24 family protein
VNAASDRTANEGSAVTSELVERAQRGDHEAFDALATAAYHRLYAIARRILRDGYAAEDAVQDALV